MREIKFRVWHKRKACWISDEVFIDHTGKVDWYSTETFNRPELNMDDIIVQQYTGLKDRNNQEIYEGDIVKVTYERDGRIETSYNGQVKFGDCCLSYTSESPQHSSMGFYLETKNKEEPQVGLFQDHNLIGGIAYNKIIGNIFEDE